MYVIANILSIFLWNLFATNSREILKTCFSMVKFFDWQCKKNISNVSLLIKYIFIL